MGKVVPGPKMTGSAYVYLYDMFLTHVYQQSDASIKRELKLHNISL